jgi:hypothetical protein
MDKKELKIDFSTFMMSLASSAYCSMGLIPNPISNKVEKNLNVAKQQIDLIEMMKEKTKGNLDKQEEQVLESVLYQLHLSYVKASEEKADDKAEIKAESKSEDKKETKTEGGKENDEGKKE